MDTRPTPDRLRETLFNIIAAEVKGSVFVDAYAGTGAVGMEAVSRGARHVVLIEKNKAAAGVIKQNLETLKIGFRARLITGATAIHLGGIPADIVFLDPPYDKEREYIASFDALAQKPPKLLIVQHAVRFEPGEECGPLHRTRVVKTGDNALSFYRATDLEDEEPESEL